MSNERGRQKECWIGTEDNLFGDPETHQSGQKHRNFSNCSCFADYNEPSEVLNRRQNCPRQSLSPPLSLSLPVSVSLALQKTFNLKQSNNNYFQGLSLERSSNDLYQFPKVFIGNSKIN